MHGFNVNTVNQAYTTLSIFLYTVAKDVGNTAEIQNVSITIKDTTDPIAYRRDISLSYALGELVWYFAASNDVKFISKFGSMWKKISDDGKTNNSAYGYILKHKHGFDQIKTIIELLKKDPNSRRALLNINVPNRDVITTKDEPCTIGIQFLIRDGLLNMTAMMRSNDIWFGFPYDAIYFTTIQKYIARELGIPTGEYTHFVTSLHMYHKDKEKIKESLETFYDRNNKVFIDYMYIVDNALSLYYDILEMENPKEEIVDYFISKGIVKIGGSKVEASDSQFI